MENVALSDCTFHPEIDQRSDLLMQKRIWRYSLSGSVHEALYKEAVCKRERELARASMCGLPVDCPSPQAVVSDISTTLSPEDHLYAINRLVYSKSCPSQRQWPQSDGASGWEASAAYSPRAACASTDVQWRAGSANHAIKMRCAASNSSLAAQSGRGNLAAHALWDNRVTAASTTTPDLPHTPNASNAESAPSIASRGSGRVAGIGAGPCFLDLTAESNNMVGSTSPERVGLIDLTMLN